MKPEYSSVALLNEKRSELDELVRLCAYDQCLVDRITEAMPQDALSYLSLQTGAVAYTVSGNKSDLATAVRALRTHGFETDEQPPAANDASWDARFHKQGFPGHLYLFFSSKVCQRVKVGTKTVTREEDVYEIRCEEAS